MNFIKTITTMALIGCCANLIALGNETEIYDNLLAQRVEGLELAVEKQITTELTSRAFLVKRAADRFEILYGSDELKLISSEIAELMDKASSQAPSEAERTAIKSYRSSLLKNVTLTPSE